MSGELPHKIHTGGWSFRLLGCFEDCGGALEACLCPCVSLGKSMKHVPDDALAGCRAGDGCFGDWVNADCCIMFLLGGHGAGYGYGLLRRWMLRSSYKIGHDKEGAHCCKNFCLDFLAHGCCPCCALVQQRREGEFRREHPAGVVMQQPHKQQHMPRM